MCTDTHILGMSLLFCYQLLSFILNSSLLEDVGNECPKFLNILLQIFRVKKTPSVRILSYFLICLICLITSLDLALQTCSKIGHFQDLMSLSCLLSQLHFISSFFETTQRHDRSNAAAFTLCDPVLPLTQPIFVPPEADEHNFISIWILQVD